MCGFFGAVNLIRSHLTLSDKEKFFIERELKKRGPDFQQHLIFKNSIFYHSRLSLVDLSDTSNQPITTKCGRYTFVYNGEIYNYKSLANQYGLMAEVAVSDTIVIKKLLEKGLTLETFVHEIDGMFSIAIYDDFQKECILARDRYGEKPLYYFFQNGRLDFSSDAFLLATLHQCKIPKSTARQFIKYGFIPPRAPLYVGINTIEAGNLYRFKHNRVEKTLVKSGSPLATNFDKIDIKSNFKISLLDSVETRLQADVEIGVFLSGGVDSALIASAAKKINKSIKSFSVALPGSKNEISNVSQLVEVLDIESHVLEIDEKSFLDHFDYMFDELDSPFSDTSTILYCLLTKFARSQVKSVLTGDGADEMLWGYPHNRPGYFINKFSRWPLNSGLFRNLSRGSRLFKLTGQSCLEQLDRYYDITRGKVVEDEIGLISGENYLEWDIYNYLPGNILKKSDRSSMAFGLEVRSPFLSNNFYQLHNHILNSQNQNLFYKKKLQREVLCEWNGYDTTSTTKKGFSFDLKDIIQKTYENFGGPKLTGIMRQLDITNIQLPQGLSTIPPREAKILWRLICLCKFMERRGCSIDLK